ncbi:collagenase-like PrtC family protease [Clostridium saccharoperbutylacetonicum]|uniref:Peptidase U32 n=1 Tax=Clostridium saccharoperbutylacetonicum N1-4(HMT) TaxID=931276 RepID=M1MV51_9CLOT|nr:MULTISPECIES: U32 family peptidase [Clostridium]AGF58536.1 peptidase U32 [Clostridium saccharoperbutylacetonicum N1-4(HMT)]NRT60686.1 collagenase-like PrtC family protease [Clostridium saccharoperbutylacetonicum]NSB24000.1 collagenase-like PrtC family protease [Clostridium saccharoperbutylacetonicum]NSB43376.1 collagenase-like PrtC family protease [Clostridium saccharoperbutylacetonicum]
MKIVAGLGCIDDYLTLVKAGVDEVFCGYVPYEWNKKYGSLFPLNRREVLYYNVQINSFEDMKILKKMMDRYKVPVNITFNYLYYLEEQYEMIAKMIKALIDIGFYEFIIADLALILYLKENGIKCSIHLSGECVELNRLSVDFFNKFDISRYIFHRKNSIEDMKACIEDNKDKNIEYEAFILNERCHYTGAFCNSLHCDEMIHLCKMPYKLTKENKFANNFKEVDQKLEAYMESDYDIVDEMEDSDVLGGTGCGLCSLQKMKIAGVTHLKVVGRGNSVDNMKRDVEDLRKALSILEDLEECEAFEEKMKDKLFCNKCSGSCYY